MEVLTLTNTNNKDFFVNVSVFLDVSTATKTWNGIMLDHKGELLQVAEVKKQLKDDGFLLFTFKDGFDRKQAFELSFKKITLT